MRFKKDGWSFSQLPIWATCDPRLTDGTYRLLGYLDWRQGTDAGTWPGISRMAEDLNVSEDTIRRRLRDLESAGYIRTTFRPGRSSWYVAIADPDNASEKYTPRKNAPPAKMQGDPPQNCKGTPRKIAGHDDNHERDSMDENHNVAPATPDVPTVPACFPEWQTYIRNYVDSNGKKNYQSALRYMFTTLYPGHDPPEYSYLAKVARKVGGAGRLADLLWQSSTRPPTGDVLAYVQGIARKDKEKVEPAGFQAIRDLAEEEGWTSGDVTGSI